MRDIVLSQGGKLTSPETPYAEADQGGERSRRIRFGLATRMLVLAMAFVMTAATMIYLPAMSISRENWLRNRLSAAYTAALVLEAAPPFMTKESLSRQLLDSVGARIIVLSKRGTKRILAASDLPPAVDQVYDLRDPRFGASLVDAIEALLSPDGRVITVVGDAPMGGESVAITMDEAPLKRAMRAYSQRLLVFTLVMSGIVAILATIAIHLMVLRPVRRLTTNLMEFGADPENIARVIVPSGANHEIGHAEAALAVMQEALARELNEKKHLAALGLAVAKINHDLRNMLSAAQLLSDRLANVTDPLAQRLAPKVVATLDRAIRFCQATLTYGRAIDEPPKLRRFLLRPLVEEVIATSTLEGESQIRIVNDVADDFEFVADAEQMFRVLMNLIRNAVDALQSAGASPGLTPEIRVDAWREQGSAVLEVTDTGPGVPQAVRAKLFTAFFNSSRPGGSGLGLAIAADLVRAHGGEIKLVDEAEYGGEGAKFRISLPLREPANP